jgi:hypothetical protein
MSIDGRKLVARIKSELRITSNADDPRLGLLAEEAVYSLQQFKCKTIVDAVTDASTETTLSPLDLRYCVVYVGLQYDGDQKLDAALGSVLEQVREK